MAEERGGRRGNGAHQPRTQPAEARIKEAKRDRCGFTAAPYVY